MVKLTTQFDSYKTETRLSTPTCCGACCSSCCCCSCIVTVVASGVITSRHFKNSLERQDWREAAEAAHRKSQRLNDDGRADGAENAEPKPVPKTGSGSRTALPVLGGLIGLSLAALLMIVTSWWFIGVLAAASLIGMVVLAIKNRLGGSAVTAIILTVAALAAEFFIWAFFMGVL